MLYHLPCKMSEILTLWQYFLTPICANVLFQTPTSDYQVQVVQTFSKSPFLISFYVQGAVVPWRAHSSKIAMSVFYVLCNPVTRLCAFKCLRLCSLWPICVDVTLNANQTNKNKALLSVTVNELAIRISHCCESEIV